MESASRRSALSLQVGRVGVLAAALGVGTAVAIALSTPASADAEQSPSRSPSQSPSGPSAPSSTASAAGTTARTTSVSRAQRPARAARSALTRRLTVADSTISAAVPKIRQSAAVTSAAPQAPAVPAFFSALAAVGRDVQRIFDNRYPTTSPSITGESPDGVVTGSLGAIDRDGDRLVYSVIGAPTLGRVSIEQATGTFTYTPVVDVASYGGTDAFTVSVSDDTGFHIHGLQGLVNAPIRLLRAIPFVGSLLSDYLPATTTIATVKLTFDGTGTQADLAFPEGFRWAVSTAGFQSEMGRGAPADVNSDW